MNTPTVWEVMNNLMEKMLIAKTNEDIPNINEPSVEKPVVVDEMVESKEAPKVVDGNFPKMEETHFELGTQIKIPPLFLQS